MDTISRRIFLASAAAGLSLHSGLSAAQAPNRLKVGFSPINEYTGLFVAKDQGFFQKRGLDVELQLIPVNATMPAALLSNSIQIGTPSITTTLQAVEGGMNLQFLCGAGVLSAAHPTIRMLARDGSGLGSVTDFKGRRVGVSALNATFHVIAREWLSKGGVDWKSVSFVETPFTQMFDLLRGGQVDALVASDPALSRIVAAGVGRPVGNLLDAVMDNALSGNYCVTAEFAAKNKPALMAFRQSIDEAHAFAAANPEPTRRSVAKYLGLPEDVIAKVTPPILASQIHRAQVEFWVKVVRGQGMLRRDVQVDALMAGMPA